MNEMRHALPSRRGVALVITLGIVLVVGLLVLGGAVMGVMDRGAAANQYRSNAAYYLALTGIDVMKTAIFRSLVEAYEETGVGWCESPVEGGVKDGEGVVIFLPGTEYGPRDGQDPFGGTYSVSYRTFGSILVIESRGLFGNAVSRVRLVASSGPGPATAWDNAITAQGRPGTKAIAGNVSVYGSVQIVRGDIGEDDEIQEIDGSIDTGGTAGIYSDYYGTGAAGSDIRSLIGNLVDTEVDLCARVKIARGNIYASGNVEIGIDSPLERRQVYSVHLGDGVVCDRNRQACNPSNPNHVVTDHNESARIWLRYPDVGMSLTYEPFELTLPRLDASGFNALNVLRVSNDPDPVMDACRWLYDDGGVIRLPPVDAATDSQVCTDGDSNSIQWVAAMGGQLLISGWVNLSDANLVIDAPLNYVGRGTLLVGDSASDFDATVDVNASVRPSSNNTYLREFGGDELAIISSGDSTFNVAANDPPSAVLLYAGRDFISKKQGVIVGAVVAERFDLQQVPKIAYHPDVRFAANRLCLPGTPCAEEGGTAQSEGILANIAIERY